MSPYLVFLELEDRGTLNFKWRTGSGTPHHPLESAGVDALKKLQHGHGEIWDQSKGRCQKLSQLLRPLDTDERASPHLLQGYG